MITFKPALVKMKPSCLTYRAEIPLPEFPSLWRGILSCSLLLPELGHLLQYGAAFVAFKASLEGMQMSLFTDRT